MQYVDVRLKVARSSYVGHCSGRFFVLLTNVQVKYGETVQTGETVRCQITRFQLVAFKLLNLSTDRTPGDT